ncbi:hypothetical protein D3790_10570 [Xenorhabdus nematophila]|nr:hypothetical protein D3790_10570 [Xenorhabdus nematophila]
MWRIIYFNVFYNHNIYHVLYLSCVIHFVFQTASLLAAFAHPGHIVIYAPGDLLSCRRDAT